jgi:hypothetical protein
VINFRFHIASLVAVFLALALGIVIGSTVIDRAIVDRLNNRLDDIQADARETRRQNGELEAERDRQQAYLDSLKAYAVANRLDGVPVVPLALRGVDETPVTDAVELARESGAIVPGVLWLEPKLALADAATVEELATILGDPTLTRREARATLWQALAERLRAGGTASSGDGDLLTALADAGFVQFQTVGDTPDDFSLESYPGLGSRVLLVDGTGAELAVDGTVVPLARTLAADAVPVVAGEVYLEEDGGPDRATGVAPIRDDDELASSVSTVDDLDQLQGRIAAVLALADLTRGTVGHYGEGSGATAPLPASLTATGS